MNNENPRATMIMGAGAVLDMDIPCGITKPSTWNITNAVRASYEDVFDDSRQITIVEDIYQHLIKSFPLDNNIWWETNPVPNIHFEILFHVMEQLLAYEGVWSGDNHNPDRNPHFGLLTSQNFNFSRQYLRQIMWKFILRIMDIVNDYDNYFRNDGGKEDWFGMQDFGAWGEGWPNAVNVGWKYEAGFDVAQITAIEVGIKDADGKQIVKGL